MKTLDNLELVARPEGVVEARMDNDLVCRTAPEWDGNGPHPLSLLANHDPEYWAERRRTFSEDWRAAKWAVERDLAAKRGDLYFIRAGNRIKIGRTVNIANRLSKMQADNHEDLCCLLVLRGRGHEEGEWHKRFVGDRIRGEWFRATPDLGAAIAWLREEQALAQKDISPCR